MRVSRDIREIAAELDEVIEKAEQLRQFDALSKLKKLYARRPDLKKGPSHDPFSPHEMTPDSPYYNPYAFNEGEYGVQPHPVQHWVDQGKRAEDYLATQRYFDAAGSARRQASQIVKLDVSRIYNLGKSVDRLIEKAMPIQTKPRGVPIGTVHTYSDGQRYRKTGEGSWELVTTSKQRKTQETLAHPKKGKKVAEGIEGHAGQVSRIQEALNKKKGEDKIKHAARRETLEQVKGAFAKLYDGEMPKEMEKHFEGARLPAELYEKVKRQAKGKGHELALKSDELEHILSSGKYALVSAGRNPNHPEDKNLDDKTISQRYEKLRSELVKSGYVYTKVTGHYGGVEDSFLVMVHDHDHDQMIKLAKELNQDSVIVANGGKQQMVYTTGKNEGQANKGEGYKPVGNDQPDFYSEVKTADGKNVKFALNFDFDKLAPADVKKVAKSITILTDVGGEHFVRTIPIRKGMDPVTAMQTVSGFLTREFPGTAEVTIDVGND